ncbi:MAG: ArsR family transcriptional regulator [Caudoviricetes sp.]|nr:MAG: ArsR family transcriptional regulator [Caudoviricetes sp.]
MKTLESKVALNNRINLKAELITIGVKLEKDRFGRTLSKNSLANLGLHYNLMLLPVMRIAHTKTLPTLTELETKTVEGLRCGDEFENYPTQCIQNLVDETGLSTRVLRALLSQLIQKGYVKTGEYPNGMTAFHLIK